MTMSHFGMFSGVRLPSLLEKGLPRIGPMRFPGRAAYTNLRTVLRSVYRAIFCASFTASYISTTPPVTDSVEKSTSFLLPGICTMV